MIVQEIQGPDWKAPLYVKFDTELDPQDAFVELRPEYVHGPLLRVDWNVEVGNSVPISVFHGRVIRWPISPRLRAEALRKLLKEVEPLAEKLVEGYTVEWDGSNVVGSFDNLEKLSDQIQDICDEYTGDFDSLTAIWKFEDWIEPVTVRSDVSVRIDGAVPFVIMRTSSNEGLEALANVLVQEAETEYIQFEESDNEIADILKDMRDSLEDAESVPKEAT